MQPFLLHLNTKTDFMDNTFRLKKFLIEYVLWVIATLGWRIISHIISALIGHRDLNIIENILYGYQGVLFNSLVVTLLSRMIQRISKTIK